MMKTIYTISRVVLVTALVFASVLSVSAAKGDFGAWELKTGHGGMKSSPVGFTEKSITIEFWLNVNEDTSVEKTAIMGTTNGDAGFLVSVRANSLNDNALELRLFAKDTEKNTAHFFVPREEFVNKWVHVAYVISAEDEKAYMYLNGGYADEKSAVGGYFGNSSVDLSIAQWWSDPKPNGKMAEIRIWNVARTGDQIAENYDKRLTGKEEGLYLYYNFDNFDQVITNVAKPGTNDGSLSPVATWSDVFAYEVLAAIPTNVSMSSSALTWSGAADSFDIEIVEAGTGNVVKEDVATGNSYSLTDLGLDANETYYARVRAKNAQFCSDWALSSGSSAIWNPSVESFSVYTKDNSIIINSDIAQSINVFAIDGCLVRSVDLAEGENVISNISKGVYIVGKQKVIVR
ncbi:LamG-like jellyroll fold domain-containing protein [Dysgonomonas sp. 520]|uniref:LamG-like jellyroll fold domain-containing protein n=1 Tax=Dysgonomonas sp. 520 TaxID=2302931 RepID=UPI0013D1391E|nr:LamG-like jellyroll fold domain-containing protein [Dysgonomonas sp. 520]